VLTRKLKLRETARDRSDEVEREPVRSLNSRCSRYRISGPKEAVLDHCAHLIQKDRRPSKKNPEVVRSDPSRMKDASEDENVTLTLKQNNWTGD
jgi:hypothetical protein